MSAIAEKVLHRQLRNVRAKKKYARRSAPAPAIAILGVMFDNVTLRGAIQRIEEMVETRRPHYVITANVDFLVQARRDAELHDILLDAHLVLCDGMPLVWASRWLGNPLPERVAGADLVPELIKVAAEKNYRLFLLGATPEANAQAAANILTQFPQAIIAGCYSPPFKPLSKSEQYQIFEKVHEARPDILLVAFGCPKAEKWIAAHYRALGVPVTIGVGATIDFLAGHMKRAPLWMQKTGTEWIFRMCQEPRRLFRRYVSDLWHFGREIPLQWWNLKPKRKPEFSSSYCSTLWKSEWQRIRAPINLDVDIARRGNLLWRHAEDHHLLLDLADVDFIDSTGVGLLLQLRKKTRHEGRRLVLLSPSEPVQRALKFMRVQNCFATINSLTHEAFSEIK